MNYSQLSPHVWDEIRNVMDILEPFGRWTKLLQVNHANGLISGNLHVMDEHLSHPDQIKI